MTDQTMSQLITAIEDLQSDIGVMETDFLKLNGWRHTSRTPGSYWMWKKIVDKTTFMVDKHVAIRMSIHFMHPDKCDPGCCRDEDGEMLTGECC